jgi:protein gp37
MEGRLQKSWAPTVHEDRLVRGASFAKKLPSGTKVFVGSMGDVFDKSFSDADILRLMNIVRSAPQVVFQFLTKCSDRLEYFDFPANAWVGVTCESSDLISKRITPLTRCNALVKFVSIEPIHGYFEQRSFAAYGINWVIVGCQTGAEAKPQNMFHVASAIDAAHQIGVAVFVKKNTGMDNTSKRRPMEFPFAGTTECENRKTILDERKLSSR